MSFDSELQETVNNFLVGNIRTVEDTVQAIKSLISKYAPKEKLNAKTHHCMECPCYGCNEEGFNLYRTELFNTLTIKEDL